MIFNDKRLFRLLCTNTRPTKAPHRRRHRHSLRPWNPAAEAQATDRAYRIGQDKPVFVHKLLCQDTVEEGIHKLQQEKAKLAAGLLADADISSKLDASMVRALLEE